MDLQAKFLANPTINPETNRHIKINGPVYKKLVKKYGQPTLPSEQELRDRFHQNPHINPETTRAISPNGAVYAKLVAKYGLSMCECCVCYEETVPVNKKTRCGHSICLDCTVKLSKNSCPMCRTSPIVSDYIAQRPEPIRSTPLQDILVRLLVNHYGANEDNVRELMRDGLSVSEISQLLN